MTTWEQQEQARVAAIEAWKTDTAHLNSLFDEFIKTATLRPGSNNAYNLSPDINAQLSELIDKHGSEGSFFPTIEGTWSIGIYGKARNKFYISPKISAAQAAEIIEALERSVEECTGRNAL